MFKIESYKKGILFSMIGNFISRILFFLQGVMIAYYYGTESKTDIYFFSISIITLIAYIINTLDSTVLIPESMRLSEQSGKKESIKFLNVFFYLYLLIGTFSTLIFFIDPVKIFSVLSRFDENVLAANKEILFLSIPLLMLMIVTGLLGNIMASYKYFTMPAIISALNNFFSLIFLILFHGQLDIMSIYLGLMIAYFINLAVLIYMMRTKIGWDFAFHFYPIKRKIFQNIFYSQAGNISSLFASYLPIYLLSGFGKGVIAALNYGQKTAEVPNQLMTIQFSSVLGIKFNELYAKQDYAALNKTFLSSAKFLLFILVPLSAFMFLYKSEIISMLFARGAFNIHDVQASSDFFQYFVFLLPLYAVNTVVARLFMAGQRIKEAFWNQLLFNLAVIILTVISLKYFGASGYPVALLVVYLINILTCYIWMKILFPFIHYAGVVYYLWIIYALNALLFLFLYWLKPYLTEIILVNLSTCAFIYAGILFLLNRIFNLNEDIVSQIGIIFRKK